MRFSCLWLSLMLSLVLIYAFNRGHTPTASPRVNLVSRGRGGGGEQRARWLRSAEMLQMSLITHYEEISVPTGRNINLQDITSKVDDVVQKTKVKEGVVTVLSKHSTVSVVIQEFEPRFVDDARQFLLRLAPPDFPYLHNDLDYRMGPADWPGGDDAWREFRASQPVNAHSHLIAMLAGTSESIPIHEGKMKIGTYQNIIVIEADGCDGTKKRNIAVQIMGCSS